MKSFEKVRIPKGTIGYESENGYNNWWYPSSEKEIEMPMDSIATHLQLWKHQHTYYAFKVPMIIFHPEDILECKDQYVCVWFFHEDIHEIIKNSRNRE